MYDELIKDLRENHDKYFARDMQAADVIEELAGFVQEAERDRDEYRERLDKANDAIEQLTADLERSKEWETFWEKEANEALKKLQTTVASIPRWIPVAERLPEKAGKYLVCGRWRGEPTEIWVCEFMTLGCLKGWTNNAANPVVSHWMELPPAPKEEE